MIDIPFLEVIVASPEISVVCHDVGLASFAPQVDPLAHVLLVVEGKPSSSNLSYMLHLSSMVKK